MSGSGRLAIDGGTPVRTAFLPYARQQIDDHDVEAVAAALRSDQDPEARVIRYSVPSE